MKSSRAMMAMAAMMMMVGGVAPIGAEEGRNYDIQGPKPVAGPPTAVEADMPSRQQRRWKDRQNKKRR